MLVIFMKHKYLLILIFSLLLLSIICQIIMGAVLQKMIKETDNMAATENKLLKQCKLKYTNCYKLNGRMVNTSVFVDKFIQKMKFFHLPFIRLSHISGQLMMLSVLVSGITICLSLASGDTLFQIIPYYMISILGLYLYFSISGIVDIQGKKTILKTDMVDYLENHLVPRLEIEKDNFMKEEDKKHETIPEPADQVIPVCAEYQEELEDLLKEFFA